MAKIFPDAYFVLMEPNPQIHDEITNRLRYIRDRFILVAEAASRHDGDATLNVWKDPRHKNPVTAFAASSLHAHVQGEPASVIPVRTAKIDTVASRTGKPPDLLKLDLQGAEISALEGARHVMQNVKMCIVEFGCLDAYLGRTTPKDLFTYFYDHHFCLYDIVDLRYRPYDGALAGGDFLFVHQNSPLRRHKDYF